MNIRTDNLSGRLSVDRSDPSVGVGCSAVRTDYGSTILNSGSNADNVEDITIASAAEQTTSTSYQNLASSSTSNLYRKSISPTFRRRSKHLASRFANMTVDVMPNSETRQIIQRMEFFLNVLNQMCIGFVTIFLSWLCLSTGLAGTALHAWLVTIGFSFLMAEAIMCHYSGNVLTFNYKRSTKTTIHWVFQALGGGCGVAGVLIKCIQKGFLLKSTHGKLGFAAFILCLFSMISGLSALFSTRVKQFLSPLLNKTFHNLLGLATFVIALVTQYYGYWTGFFSRHVDATFQTTIGFITLLSLVLTCIGPMKALYNKFKNIARHFK